MTVTRNSTLNPNNSPLHSWCRYVETYHQHTPAVRHCHCGVWLDTHLVGAVARCLLLQVKRRHYLLACRVVQPLLPFLLSHGTNPYSSLIITQLTMLLVLFSTWLTFVFSWLTIVMIFFSFYVDPFLVDTFRLVCNRLGGLYLFLLFLGLVCFFRRQLHLSPAFSLEVVTCALATTCDASSFPCWTLTHSVGLQLPPYMTDQVIKNLSCRTSSGTLLHLGSI